MSTRIVISPSYPSVKEVASELGVNADSVRELRMLLNEIVKINPNLRAAHNRATAISKKKKSSVSVRSAR